MLKEVSLIGLTLKLAPVPHAIFEWPIASNKCYFLYVMPCYYFRMGTQIFFFIPAQAHINLF